MDQRAAGRLGTPAQVANPETRDRFLVASSIEEAISSSQLEGAATTRKIAKEMIRSGRTPRDRSERMILNNYRAISQIGGLLKGDLTRGRIESHSSDT